MTEIIDTISPVYIGEDKFTLTIDEASKPLLSYKPLSINIDYSEADPEGVVLPIIIVVQPAFGDGTGYIKKTFSRSAPSTFSFFASAGAGDYLILVREYGHNQWQGRLVITVGGDDIASLITERSS
jgi:hypothetical protein